MAHKLNIRHTQQIQQRPLVAVTGPAKRLRIGGWAAQLMLALSGLRSCYITVRQPQLKEKIQGIIIGGGDDIEPHHYGATGDAGTDYDPERDAFEMAMLRKALDAGLPILGICRGAQLINIIMQGSLHQDIRPLRHISPRYNSALPVKRVKLHKNSRLYHALGMETFKVNQLHNQAVDRLGNGLNSIAHDQDNIIQAIEADARFILGVQWHPEYLPYLRSQRRLFNYFATTVRASSAKL